MIIEYSIILAFIAMLFWGVGDFLIQRNVRRIGNLESLAYIGIIGAIMLLPFVYDEFSLLMQRENLGLLLLLGLITFIGAWFNFEALKKGKLAVVDVILELELPVVVVFSIIYFKESLSLLQVVVMGALLIGVVLVALESLSLRDLFKRLEKGVFLGMIAALGMGLIDVTTAASSRTISPLMAIWFPWMFISVLSLIFIMRKEKMSLFLKNGMQLKYWIFGMAIFDTLAWLAYANAMKVENIAVVTAITESYPAVALFLGLWLNKEKIKNHQFLGAGVALIASFALAFFV